MSKIYFHELSDEEKAEAKSHGTVGEFLEKYKQPDWCQYPEALAGQMGCWSLILSCSISSPDDCKLCDLCAKEAHHE